MARELTKVMGFGGAFLIAPLLTALVGAAVELLMRFVYRRDPVYSLLLTFGLAFVMQGLMLWWWGPTPQEMHMVPALEAPVSPDLFFITWYRVVMVGIVIVAVIGIFAFLPYTRVDLLFPPATPLLAAL